MLPAPTLAPQCTHTLAHTCNTHLVLNVSFSRPQRSTFKQAWIYRLSLWMLFWWATLNTNVARWYRTIKSRYGRSQSSTILPFIDSRMPIQFFSSNSCSLLEWWQDSLGSPAQTKYGTQIWGNSKPLCLPHICVYMMYTYEQTCLCLHSLCLCYTNACYKISISRCCMRQDTLYVVLPYKH